VLWRCLQTCKILCKNFKTLPNYRQINGRVTFLEHHVDCQMMETTDCVCFSLTAPETTDWERWQTVCVWVSPVVCPSTSNCVLSKTSRLGQQWTQLDKKCHRPDWVCFPIVYKLQNYVQKFQNIAELQSNKRDGLCFWSIMYIAKWWTWQTVCFSLTAPETTDWERWQTVCV